MFFIIIVIAMQFEYCMLHLVRDGDGPPNIYLTSSYLA